MQLASQNSTAFRQIVEIIYLWILQHQKSKSNQSRKLLTVTSTNSSRDAPFPSGGILLEPLVVALVAPLQLLMLIPQVEIHTLNVLLDVVIHY